MEVYYKELLQNEEELARKIANVASEDNIDLIINLNLLRMKAGANHPLTLAYEREFYKRQREWVQLEVMKHTK